MLYILLTIIAIGVLLASEAGKKLLGFITILLVIGSLLFLGFWIIIIAINLFPDKDTRENVFWVLGMIIIVSYLFFRAYTLYKKYQSGELTTKIIKERTKVLWMENWKHRKGFAIFIITLFSLTLVAISWVLISDI